MLISRCMRFHRRRCRRRFCLVVRLVIVIVSRRSTVGEWRSLKPKTQSWPSLYRMKSWCVCICCDHVLCCVDGVRRSWFSSCRLIFLMYTPDPYLQRCLVILMYTPDPYLQRCLAILMINCASCERVFSITF